VLLANAPTAFVAAQALICVDLDHHDKLRLNGFDVGWCLGEPNNAGVSSSKNCLAMETNQRLGVCFRLKYERFPYKRCSHALGVHSIRASLLAGP